MTKLKKDGTPKLSGGNRKFGGITYKKMTFSIKNEIAQKLLNFENQSKFVNEAIKDKLNAI